jgi:hypothetical protein
MKTPTLHHAIALVAWVAGFTLAVGCDSSSGSDADRTKTSDKQQVVAAPGGADDAAVVASKPADRAAAADTPTPANDAGADKVAVAERKPASERSAAVKAGAAAKTGPAATAPAPDGEAQAAAVPDAKVKAADAEDGGGGSLAEKEGWANYTKDIQAKVSQVNGTCGTKLSASYDKTTYTDFDPMKDRTQAACKAAVGTLQAICATEEGKAAVQKLSKTVCKFSTTGTGASLSGSTLVIKIDPVKSSITGKAAGSYSWASAIKEVL